MILRRAVLAGGLALGACAGLPVGQGVTTETFDLWPGDPPGSVGVTATEEIIERSTDPKLRDRAMFHVRKPTLKVFRPARPDGSAALVCPGGAYSRVVLDKEGDETALRLAQSGVTAGVLVYRLPGDGWAAGLDAPLQDAARAMRLLRSGRVAPGLDAKRIGVLGFSAGGNLAAAVSLRSGEAHYPRIDEADALDARPEFSALIYAAYIDGKGPGQGFVSPDYIAMVGKSVQPMFLLHAADDATVPVESSLRMYAALKAAGSASELHVFPEGGHGFGIARARAKPVEVWPELFLSWGRARGMFR